MPKADDKQKQDQPAEKSTQESVESTQGKPGATQESIESTQGGEKPTGTQEQLEQAPNSPAADDDKAQGKTGPKYVFPCHCKGVGRHDVELDVDDPVQAEQAYKDYFGIISTKETIVVGQPYLK